MSKKTRPPRKLATTGRTKIKSTPKVYKSKTKTAGGYTKEVVRPKSYKYVTKKGSKREVTRSRYKR